MNRKIAAKLYMPNLLQFHLCSCLVILIRVTSYKKHADSQEEHGRHKHHPNNKKMHIAAWPSSQSCLPDMQITYGHTATTITKPGGIEQILGKALIFFGLLYLQTGGVKGLVASFIKHPLAFPQSVLPH